MHEEIYYFKSQATDEEGIGEDRKMITESKHQYPTLVSKMKWKQNIKESDREKRER